MNCGTGVLIPETWGCVVLSTKRQWQTSTSRLKWRKKSAPKMACLTSATMNTQWNARRSPRLRVRGQSPKVAMAELLTACKATPAWEGEQLEVSRGMTLTSALVSTRNRRPLV